MWKKVTKKTGGSTCRITYADRIVKKNVCFASDEGAFDTWNVISAIRELSTLEILKDRPHENCVNSFCVEYCDESQSCIFTFIKQQMDLSQFVTCTQLSIPYAYATFNIALQTGRAICHLHSLRLVHCDIKTENVLVSCDDRLGRVNATLCDYGLCRINNSILPQGQDVVTFSYRAPEHMANASLVQSSVDCWSFGVLILAMLLRKPHPFGTRRHSIVISNVCKFLGDEWPCQKEYLDLCSLKLRCSACDEEKDNGKHISCRNNLESKWQKMMQNDTSDRSFAEIDRFYFTYEFCIDHVPKNELLMAMSRLFTINWRKRPSLHSIMHEILEDSDRPKTRKRLKNEAVTPAETSRHYRTLDAVNKENVWQNDGSFAMSIFNTCIERS